MDNYKSEKSIIPHPMSRVYDRLSRPELFKARVEEHVDELPDEAREALKGVSFEADGITLNSPMGPLKLSVAESVPPSRVIYKALESPLQFSLEINLEPIDENTTQSQAALEIDLPFMLKTMVGSKLKDGVNQLGAMIAQLPFE